MGPLVRTEGDAMKYGRKPPYDPAVRPRVKLGPALRFDTLPAIPLVVDEVSAVPDWPMYLNDQLGDCTIAAAGHMLEAWTQYGRGAAAKVTDAEVLKAYEAVSGYVSGRPDTDQGAVMQDVLDYWRKTGIGGHRILAFAEVDVHDLGEVTAALYLFGHVYVGLSVPQSAEDQFAAGQPWDVVSHDGGILGGHAVDLGLRDATAQAIRYEVITWATRQVMTSAFWARYVEEAWVVADEDWITAAGSSPPGLHVNALNAQFTALTGKPGPFPAAPPTPVPPADADHAFADVLRADGWLTHHHVGHNATVAHAAKLWIAAKGL
jgi:hypothetical protein